jgi:hypothetical protein
VNKVKPPVCKDCRKEGVTTFRPAPHVGPRCVTHWRRYRKRVQQRSYDVHIQHAYGLTPDEYEWLYEFQGGHCALCPATGRTRRLSVDHNHKTGKVRGLLCRPCNDLFGRWRDDPAPFLRAIYYLLHPPADQMTKLNAASPEEDDAHKQ